LGRYANAKAELIALDKDWTAITEQGGDGIRRKLGTVYSPPRCDRALCSFSIFTNNFVKKHVDDLDLSAFDGPSGELLEALNQADFLAYSSVFSGYGNGGGGEDYIENSHAQVRRAIKAIDEVMVVLNEQ
jgi:hypothetical protein